MSKASRLDTLKFDAGIKQALVLRPTGSSWAQRLFLAVIKVVSKAAPQFFRSKLRLDCNERIVEMPFVMQNLSSPAGMRILDFGCTESILPIFLATQGAQVVGVDLREYEFEHPNFTFNQGDFLDNEFPAESFDAVVAVSAVEHCGLDVYGSRNYDNGDVKVVEEFRRVLKPKGLLLLTVPFGKWQVGDMQRIYDSEHLDELVDGFAVLQRLHYRKAPAATHWLQCSETECAQAGVDPVTGVQGVALLLCERTPEPA